jgi:NTP pyrophosphatase (non-canonical NTP hydrolase)
MLEQAVKDLASVFPERNTERWIRAVAEEAGEVVGAYNKLTDGNKVKPKTVSDVIEELVQLYAVILMTADALGVHPDRMEVEAETFLMRKAEQIRDTRLKQEALSQVKDGIASIDEVRAKLDLPPWGKFMGDR